MNSSIDLVGHWPLAGHGKEISGAGLPGIVRSVTFDAEGPDGCPGTAARFDGSQSGIEVAPHPRLNFGTGDFSIALWVHTEERMGDVVGNLVECYDPETRRGFHFSVVSHPGATSSVANDRNLHFGIDAGMVSPQWQDCGRPGNAVFVRALTTFAGDLYAATCEPGAGEAGHVYRYTGEKRWEDCGSPSACNSVSCLAEYDGQLYCGVARYKLSGSCLPDSPNKNPGGAVYRYIGGREWVECGQLDQGDGVHCICAFGGKLYATPTYEHQVLEYQGGCNWRPIGPDARVMAMGYWNGHLYGLTSGRDSVYRYEGDCTWTDCGWPEETSQLYSFLVYQGKPHIGTWPRGEVFRYDGDRTWTLCGSPGYSREVMGMALYNGKLYAGTLPMADVYRYEGRTAWSYTGGLDRSHGYPLRRAWTMAVYRGKLYCGTLPSGVVYSLEAGRMATWDHRFPGGWHHLAAVRRSQQLEIWMDGKQVANSEAFPLEKFDLTTGRPLLIGSGQHDHFCGCLSDLRLYSRALLPEDLVNLNKEGRT